MDDPLVRLEPGLRLDVEPGQRQADTTVNSRQIDRVWDVIEKVGVAMLTTWFAGGLRARPLETRPDRGAGGLRVRQG
jgi:hypothetical protein